MVGNPRRFNAQGTVPTNSTARDVLKSQDENHWHSAEAIALMAGIAGLFHDFGKANALFQAGLIQAGRNGFNRIVTNGFLCACFRPLSVSGKISSGWPR